MSKAQQQPAEIASQLFEAYFDQPSQEIVTLPVSGSDRKYFRVSNDQHQAIATVNTNVAENNSYFYFTETFPEARHSCARSV